VALIKSKDAYKAWLQVLKDFPRVERYGLGSVIDAHFIKFLEKISETSFMSIANKIEGLGTCISKLDTLKFLLQLAWETKLIHTTKYSALSIQIEEIGRMLGGWKRGILDKLPNRSPGERP